MHTMAPHRHPPPGIILADNNANRIDSPLSPSLLALPPPAEGSAKASLSTGAKIGPMASGDTGVAPG
jgi:hypothetical protein